MKTPRLSFVLMALASVGFVPADARTGRDEDAAYDARVAGQNRSLPEIEAAVIPRMGGARYIGPEILDSAHYRLKFMRGSKVIWVDVDARSGQIVGRAGD